MMPIQVANRQVDSYEPIPTLKKEGDLRHRKVKIYYPEFGENIAKVKQESWISTLKKAAPLFALVAAGAAIGGVIGTLVSLALIGTVALVSSVYNHINRKCFVSTLPQNGQRAQDEPRIGKYYDANVRLLDTADAGLKWKRELIAAAEESIELSCNFAGGSVFRDFLALLDSKMTSNERVKTHMIVSNDQLEKDDKALLKNLKEKFGDRFMLLVTNRHYKLGVDLYSEENHVKMLVVDGKYFVSGGTGIHPRLSQENYDLENDKEHPTLAARLLEPASRDTDVAAESYELGAVMRKQFFNLYQIWETRTAKEAQKNRYYPLTLAPGHSEKFNEEDGLVKNARMKCIVSGPEHRGNNPIVKEYEKRIQASKDKLRLGSLIFCPPKAIKNALTNAKKNHPSLRRIAHLNGIGGKYSVSKGRLLNTLSGRNSYHLVDTVYEYNIAHQYYHKKVATFDSEHTIVGSFNLGRKSARYDHELVFAIKNAEVTAQCNRMFKEDRARSVKITAEKPVHTFFGKRLLSFILAKGSQNLV